MLIWRSARCSGHPPAAAPQIAANSAASRLAPPTSAPSMFAWASTVGRVRPLHRAAIQDPHIVSDLRGVGLGQLGPQRGADLLRVLAVWPPARYLSPRSARSARATVDACGAVRPLSPPSSCVRTCSRYSPASRRLSDSPTHRIRAEAVPQRGVKLGVHDGHRLRRDAAGAQSDQRWHTGNRALPALAR